MNINKYRAWDTRNNEMIYSQDDDCFYINTKGVLFMYAIPKSESGLETIYHKSYDVNLFACQVDKLGRDIYVNDIIKAVNGTLYIVKFGEHKLTGVTYDGDHEVSCTGFYLERQGTYLGDIEPLDDKSHIYLEVVGHTYL